MSTTRIADISPPPGLKPKAKYFDEVGDICLNVDMAIKLCQSVDTPQAKIIHQAFRKQHALMRQTQTGLSAEKVRENAFFAALEALSVRTTFTKIDGDMS